MCVIIAYFYGFGDEFGRGVGRALAEFVRLTVEALAWRGSFVELARATVEVFTERCENETEDNREIEEENARVGRRKFKNEGRFRAKEIDEVNVKV